MDDLRFAFRQLGKAPGFTAVAVLTLALGIGACVAIFSVVNGVLLRPLAYPESHRVVILRETFLPGIPEFSVASGKYFVWQQQARSFEGLAAFVGRSYNLTAGAGEPQRLAGMRLTANALPTFRVQPALGRGFTPAEDVPGQDAVVILSHGYWQRQFGGRPEAVGQRLQLDGRAYTVIGVMPPRSPLPDLVEVVTPMAFTSDDRDNFGGHSTNVFGRLAPGASVEQAHSELAVIQERIGRQRDAAKGWGIKVVPALEFAVGEVRPVLLALLGAVGLLLLIACANVANLLLARATVRAREIAVRTAIGASRGRIVRQLLIESLVLGVMGGALGVVVAKLGLRGLLALAPESLPRAREVAIDGRALAFTLALALLTGIVFGLAPVFQAVRLDLGRALHDGRRGAGGGGRQRLRAGLCAAEVAVALVLLAGAGLLMRSFARLQTVSPGFRPEGALVAGLSLPREKYDALATRAAFAADVLRRLEQLPGVEAVGLTQRLPLAGSQEHRGFTIQGQAQVRASQAVLNHFTVSPGYFRAMGMQLLRGRGFEAGDHGNAPRVAVINDTFARRFFPDQDPIGHNLYVSNSDDGTWRRIVGVVADVKNRGLDAAVPLQSYEPFAQQPGRDITLVVRAPAALAALPGALRAAVYAVDRDQPLNRIRPLTDIVATSIARQRFAMVLFAVFSGVALLLSAIGIYGVMAYAVSQRTGEIGIRMALGAQAGQVLRLVLAQGGRLVGLGVAAGLAGALLLTRFLEKLLFGVPAHDPLTFVAIVLVLGAAAALACLIPARRAARVDPLVALRQE